MTRVAVIVFLCLAVGGLVAALADAQHRLRESGSHKSAQLGDASCAVTGDVLTVNVLPNAGVRRVAIAW